jgi:MFS family permease
LNNDQITLDSLESRSTGAVRTAPYAWVILLVVFLASVAAPLNQNKVPPLMPVMMNAFNLTLVEAGLLMSVFAITGFILALPAGIILGKIGPKITGLLALGCLAAGSALGALAPNVNILLASRVIEGTGMGLIAVVAPAILAMWFPPQNQGTPMGIWATWVPVGSLIMYLLAPAMSATTGWQSVWWLAVIFTLVTMLLYGLFVRMPPNLNASVITQPTAPQSNNLLKSLANRDIWLLALEFGAFNLVFLALATFYPTFLSENRGYTLPQASFIASIATIAVLFSAPLAGWLSDRIGSRRLMMSLPFLLFCVILLLPFRVTSWQISALMIAQGLIVGAVPTATFAAAPEVMKDARLAGLGLAVVMVGQNLGMFIGPVLFGRMVESLGWVNAGAFLIPFCLLGFVAAWLVRVR